MTKGVAWALVGYVICLAGVSLMWAFTVTIATAIFGALGSNP